MPDSSPHSDLLARLRYRAQLGRMAGVEWQEMGQATQTALYGIAADLEEIADGLEEQMEAWQATAKDRQKLYEEAVEQLELLKDNSPTIGAAYLRLKEQFEGLVKIIMNPHLDLDVAAADAQDYIKALNPAKERS